MTWRDPEVGEHDEMALGYSQQKRWCNYEFPSGDDHNGTWICNRAKGHDGCHVGSDPDADYEVFYTAPNLPRAMRLPEGF